MKRTTFKVAVLLNITKDHIERHQSFKKYINEKIKIFNNQSEDDVSIFGVDNEVTSSLVRKLKKKLDSKIIDIGQFNNFLGVHNYQNIAAVYAIVLSLGFYKWKQIENSIKSFKALPHRLQKIKQINNITFVNDSKATNIDATNQALKNFKNVFWILGGRLKERSLQKLKKHFFRIKHVFLVGETKFLYQKYLKDFLDCTIVKNLEEAVKLSYLLAKKNIKEKKIKSSIVLLSPACSSLDEWKDFEDRGNAFIKFVKKI